MSDLSLIKLNNFFAGYTPLRYKKRHTILYPGDTPTGIFYIKTGYVRQYLISHDGKELTTIIYKSADLFPIKWAVINSPIKSYFETLTTVELCKAPKEAFLGFLRSDPDVFLKLTSRIVNRLSAVLERLEYLAFGNAYQKVISILLILAERFGKQNKKQTTIQIPLTHNDIASLIGMTRETVSIEMNKLKKKKSIYYKQRFLVIKNIDRLKEESLNIS